MIKSKKMKKIDNDVLEVNKKYEREIGNSIDDI